MRCNDGGGFAPRLRHPRPRLRHLRPHSGHPHPRSGHPTLVRVSPPSFVSPRPSRHPTLVRISPPSFASLCPHLHLPTLVCVSPTLVVCRSPPCLHRGLLVVCCFHRSRCRSRRCCFCFCCCCCACVCTRPRSKCPPGSYPAVLCSPSLLAVIQVPVKE